mgnify:CR=1 FL=1
MHLEQVDGVMIGRAAYQNPWLLADADRRIFGVANPVQDPSQAVTAMLPYIASHLEEDGAKLSHVTRHMLGLFNGRPGARSWRRHLSEYGVRKNAGIEFVVQALARTSARPYRRTADSV